MQNRIDQTFTRLRQEGKKGFIAYISAGDPSLTATRDLALAFEKSGVDLLELGVPFSDPLADGIVNQLAAQRGLDSGTTPKGVLDCVREIRKTSQMPIVLYTYLNPLYAFGFQKFLAAAEEAGVDGLLILDLPPDETDSDFIFKGNLKQIRLIAPTTPPDRIAWITAHAGGFIYYVSREGVTGEQTGVATSIAERVAAIRETTPLPIAIGFGVSNPAQAAEVARSGDAVVVGSAIVKRIAQFGQEPDLISKVCEFVEPLARATKN